MSATSSPVPDARGDGASTIVDVNVGGVRYTTTLATLAAVDGSYLSVLASNRWEPMRDSATSPGALAFAPPTPRPDAGASTSSTPATTDASHQQLPPQQQQQTLFIDRDGDMFRYVLSYLRSLRNAGTQVALPVGNADRLRLQAEAEFYGLPDLAAIVAYAIGHHQHRGAPDWPAGGGRDAAGSPAGDGAPRRAGPALSVAMAMARDEWCNMELRWAQDRELQELCELCLDHLLWLPLRAGQLDLRRALAKAGTATQPDLGQGAADGGGGSGGSNTHLELSVAFFPFGNWRVELEGAVVETGGALGGTDPRTVYYNFKIRETPSEYETYTTVVPGDAGVMIEEHSKADYGATYTKYCNLHKLLVQRSPLSSFFGLLWLLEVEGFRSPRVIVSHQHHTGYSSSKGIVQLPLA